jgi:hypothetical protein
MNPSVKIHNHSKDSMNMCGDPIGKIARILPIKGMK